MVPVRIREDFPALQNRRNGKPPIYFDNACTALVPRAVIDTMNAYYCDFPGCGDNRSSYWFAQEVTDRLEGNSERGIRGSRRIIQGFINARSSKEIIFTMNTSHAINMVALGYPFQPGDVVLISDREHNSNLIPWLRLQKSGIISVRSLFRTDEDAFDFDEFENTLKLHSVRLVSMACTSNLTGCTIPAKGIIRIAHQYGARVLLDAAQTAPHRKIDVQDLDVDFLAFSMHKLCGPKGVGVLYGKRELLGSEPCEEDEPAAVISPSFLGGGTVRDSSYTSYSLLEPPERFETGVQNYAGQIASGTAVEYLLGIGFENICEHVHRLNAFLTGQLLKRYGSAGWFRILGPQDPALRGSILTFEVKRPNAVGIAEVLSEKSNIMIRDGAFCVHSYLNHIYGQGWMLPRKPSEHKMTYRISLYFYNTEAECNVLLDTLDAVFRERSYI